MTLPLPSRAVRVLRKKRYQTFLVKQLFIQAHEVPLLDAPRLEVDLYRRVSDGLYAFAMEHSEPEGLSLPAPQYIPPRSFKTLIHDQDASISAFLDQDSPGWRGALVTAELTAARLCAVAALEVVAPDALRALKLNSKQRLTLMIEEPGTA